MRRAHAQTVAVKHFDDFGGQDGLDLLHVRALVSEVAEHVAASPRQLQLFALIAASPSIFLAGP